MSISCLLGRTIDKCLDYIFKRYMNFKRLSFVCLLLIFLASVGWAKKYTSLKVPDYKNLSIVVETVGENKMGLTTEKVENAVKLRLLGNGIKRKNGSTSHYLYVRLTVFPNGTAFSVSVEFSRFSFAYPKEISDKTGSKFVPDQGTYSMLGLAGGSASHIIASINEQLDEFLLDYLESNIE